ncbi:MAG: 30S ribosomal protein S20 [Bacteroidia bacterium]
MANHKSAKKRARQDIVRRERNRYKAVGMRKAIKTLRDTEDKEEAMKMLPEVISKIDRTAKHNIIHNNKASNLKGKLTRFVNGL